MKKKNSEIKPSRKGFVTNYPHFRYWKKPAINDLLSAPPLNIYLHVPFCIRKCAYCYYRTETYKNKAQLDGYTAALCQEMRLSSHQFNCHQRPVNSIYIGGGTPSLLPVSQLERIIDCLHENFNIETPEFTIEAEPRTISPKKVSAYKEMGINRISIGIQSFNDEIIKLSGREHTAEKALKAIDIVKDAGDIVINIDLLSGLAGETNNTWVETIDTAISTKVHNITVYRMEVYLNTEFFKKSVRKKVLQLPSEAQELELMKVALEKFDDSNYKPWSFFTVTRDGEFQHQYATNLWKGEDCLALGPSGFGTLGYYNYQNSNELDSYLAYIKKEQLPIIRAHRLTSKDLMLKDLMLGMKLCRLSRNDFVNRHGFDFCDAVPGTMEELCSEDYILLEEDTITLTPKGILYGDYVGKRVALALKQYIGMDNLSLY
ncbi:MAG: radical SAM family heme chaperone HemW [Candidatus Aminicenantes bacterium]|nr:MAG: radical SAM family heme chaperone HemW [Candidatus Aminicenantes bacterium]